MSSSVTMKALHSGCVVLSQTPGFFSTAADSWPVMGAALVCRALAIADRRVLSVQPGPTPEGAVEGLKDNLRELQSCNSAQDELHLIERWGHLLWALNVMICIYLDTHRMKVFHCT